MGALPTLYAATRTSRRHLIGPGGAGRDARLPRAREPAEAAQDAGTARALWDASERLTNTHLGSPSPVALRKPEAHTV